MKNFNLIKKFNLDGPDGVYHYWKLPKSPGLQRSKRSFGGGSVMVWGAICGDQKLALVVVDTRLDSAKYQQLLTDHLLPVLKAGMVFQQDNAPCHASRSTKTWLEDNNVPTCSWPSLSPDLNPIESVWGKLAMMVYKPGSPSYTSVGQLKEAIFGAWDNMEVEFVRKCTRSMRKRLCKVLEEKGESIDY
ncbi:hypothetical protein FOL47_007367 [Perkinsus chesapeaki]|uniref:Tc1-like transposase DDE domain-containing protein n=1 Tax=Perkinsus chesapeaki TaxID=330153 RepID=A0A7J6LM26_PERCH|nr:hypothetical protein FOL47_007367 [Perkinsus chesapeaki]